MNKLDIDIRNVLTEPQIRVMLAVVEEESLHREHLVVALSGAHAYGFPSPDSDLDLKSIHIANTADLLGFAVPTSTVDRLEVIDGVEIDYTSNELGPALAGVLRGNGNYIERILGRLAVAQSPVLAELQPIVIRSLSQRVFRHYRGFAHRQLQELSKDNTAKKLLYVLRTALTGIHLLTTGQLETDLTRLVDTYRVSEATELVAKKRAGERVTLEPSLLAFWRPRVDGVLAELDKSRTTGCLPEEPKNEGEIHDWLLKVRRSRFL